MPHNGKTVKPNAGIIFDLTMIFNGGTLTAGVDFKVINCYRGQAIIVLTFTLIANNKGGRDERFN